MGEAVKEEGWVLLGLNSAREGNRLVRIFKLRQKMEIENVRWLMPIVRLMQEDCYKSEASLELLVSSYLPWLYSQNLSQTTKDL